MVKHGGSRGRFYPTEIGVVVCDLLVKNFPYIFDTAYTAKLEDGAGRHRRGQGEVDRSAERLL